MSHLHQHWYGLCHRCPIQGAISGLSKHLTHPVPLEAPHPRDAQPRKRGAGLVSVLQSQRMPSLAGDARHEHAPALSHPSHLSDVSNVGDASSAPIRSGTV
ncbi:hypothetical protein NPIL_110411 [Nephila pilipes]|uniref:Uncharacterized protein n=1 Tax=Nephila pilipes TaxID=299642 RepID=A0A8X6THG5_NEPPI|nr:hypothetical protein NPIL_110411 [Nephila pilipes]